MAIFIKRFIIFLLPIILIAGSLEIYLKNRTDQNEILAKLELVEQNKDATMIFVGNSHGRNAFIPELIEQKSINLCIGGSTSFYNLKLLETVVEKMPELKHIVYNISYQTLFYDLDSLPDKKKIYEFYHYLGVDAGVDKYSSDYFSILSTIGFNKAIGSCLHDLRAEKANLIETNGYNEEASEISVKKVEKLSIQRVVNHHKLMNPDKLAHNLDQLEAIENLAKKHDINIVYVILPVVGLYRSEMESPFDSYALKAEKFASDHDRLVYNLADSLELDDTHFVDPDHLNHKGAYVISNYLSQALKKDVSN